jgi:hypothetical protein
MKVVPVLAEIVALTPAVIALDRRPPWQLRPTLSGAPAGASQHGLCRTGGRGADPRTSCQADHGHPRPGRPDYRGKLGAKGGRAAMCNGRPWSA